MLTRNTKSLVWCRPSPCGALILAGCVTVPDTIKGSTATPVMHLSSVQHAPNLFTRAEARFGRKVMNITNKQGHRQYWKLLLCRSTRRRVLS